MKQKIFRFPHEIEAMIDGMTYDRLTELTGKAAGTIKNLKKAPGAIRLQTLSEILYALGIEICFQVSENKNRIC